jgi:hypothetical protein
MYIISNQTTIKCCLSISICFMLLYCQSITSQTSISFLFVLNYEFPLVFPFFVRFRNSVYPAPVSVPDYSRPDPVFDDKLRIRKRERVFSSVFISIVASPSLVVPSIPTVVARYKLQTQRELGRRK